MHNAAFAALGLNYVYVPLPVPPDRIGDAVRGLVALGFAGANVTVPHKSAVLPLMDDLTPIARAVAAVNTVVVRPDGSLLGDNTDGYGFMADLRGHGVEIGQRMESANQRVSESANQRVSESANQRVSESANQRVSESASQRIGESASQRVSESANRRVSESANQRVSESANQRVSESANQRVSESMSQQTSLCHRVTVSPCHPVTLSPCHRVILLGAGGAARAVAYALTEAGATVAVCNRTLSRANELCQTIRRALPDAAITAHPFPDGLPELAEAADLIVDATSLGLHGDADPLPWDPTVPFRADQVVYDLIYNVETPLLKLAAAGGAQAIAGLGMLVHQGARSFELWTGRAAPVDVMFAAVMDGP